jgi:WD40 repeat protein
VKIWDLTEGREPWQSTLPQPTVRMASPSGVWALASAAPSGLLLAGTEDGAVVALDSRSPRAPVWETLVCDGGDYIGGLAAAPDGRHVVAAAADGALSLLDFRKGGARVSRTACGAPLRCVATDGGTAAAGGEGGMIALWDVALQLGVAGAPAGTSAPGLDGLYEPLRSVTGEAVNALAVVPGENGLLMAAGHEDGSLGLFEAVAMASS